MQNIKFIITFNILLVSILAISCKNSEISNTDKAISNTQHLVPLISDFYTKAQKYTNLNEQKTIELKSVLINQNIEISKKPIIFIQNFNKKQNILSIFYDITSNINKFSNQDLIQKLILLTKAVDQADFNNSEITDKNDKIKEYVKSKELKKINAMYLIFDLLATIYFDETHVWADVLDSSYNHFAKEIDNIPDDNFDTVKLNKIIKLEHKNNDNAINLYKKELKRNAYMKKIFFLNKAFQLYNISKDITDVFNELSKGTTNQAEITAKNTRILLQLNIIENFDKTQNKQL